MQSIEVVKIIRLVDDRCLECLHGCHRAGPPDACADICANLCAGAPSD